MTNSELLESINSMFDDIKENRIIESKEKLQGIFNVIKSNPSILKETVKYIEIAKSLLFILTEEIATNANDIKLITKLGYLFISKSIQQFPKDYNRISIRLTLMQFWEEELSHSVFEAIDMTQGGLVPLDLETRLTYAIMDIHRMEIADLELHPNTFKTDEMHNERRRYIYSVINNISAVTPESTIEEYVSSGIKNHKIFYNYLNKLFQENLLMKVNSKSSNDNAFLDEFIRIAKMSRPEMTVTLDYVSELKINEYKRYVIQYQQNKGNDITKLKAELNDQHIYNVANTIRIIEITRK